MSELAEACAEASVPAVALQNVVATFELGRRLHLGEVAMRCWFVQHNPRRFAAAMIRLKSPQSTCLLFASGKAVCTGSPSEQDACVACSLYVSLLLGAGIEDVCMRNFAVQNIVSAAHCPFKLDLQRLARRISGACSYEPDMFPGLVYRLRLSTVQAPEDPETQPPVAKRPRVAPPGGPAAEGAPRRRRAQKPREVVFLCFESGKCVITGAVHRRQVLAAWRQFFNTVLCPHRAVLNHGSSGNARRCELASADRAHLPELRLTYAAVPGTVAELRRARRATGQPPRTWEQAVAADALALVGCPRTPRDRAAEDWAAQCSELPDAEVLSGIAADLAAAHRHVLESEPGDPGHDAAGGAL